MLKIDILIKQEDLAVYSDFIKSFSYTSFNSSLKFFYFLSALFKGANTTPYYLIAKDGDKIVGVLPAFLKRGKFGAVLNSLPWFGSSPGVIADSSEIANELIISFFKVAEWTNCLSATIIENPIHDFVETRADKMVDYDKVFGEYPEGIYFEDSRVGMITRLPSCNNEVELNVLEAVLMSKFHAKTRNQIRKSIDLCYWKEDYSNDSFVFLEKTHQENMIAVNAPYKQKEFSIIRTLKQGKDYKLFVSYEKKSDEPVAALLLKYFNRTVDYMVPATKEDCRESNPLHILIYQAMFDAAKRGYFYWNWGGSLVDGMEGVKHFKRRFGAKEILYHYHTKQFRPLPSFITTEMLLENYPYFFVIPFKDLGEFIGEGCNAC
jgi:hypothetical protein